MAAAWISGGLTLLALLGSVVTFIFSRRAMFHLRQLGAWKLVSFAGHHKLPEWWKFHKEWEEAGRPDDIAPMVDRIFDCDPLHSPGSTKC